LVSVTSTVTVVDNTCGVAKKLKTVVWSLGKVMEEVPVAVLWGEGANWALAPNSICSPQQNEDF